MEIEPLQVLIIHRVLANGKENPLYFKVKEWMLVLQKEGLLTIPPGAEDEINDTLRIETAVLELIIVRFEKEFDRFMNIHPGQFDEKNIQ